MRAFPGRTDEKSRCELQGFNRGTSGLLCLLSLCYLSGCASQETLRGADGRVVRLNDYQSVAVQEVTLDPALPYAGLSGLLREALEERFSKSAYWVAPKAEPVDAEHSTNGQGLRPRLQIAVQILDAQFPGRDARVWLGKPIVMKCLVSLSDGSNAQSLGSTTLTAKYGTASGGILLSGVEGVSINRATEMQFTHASAICGAMAEKIVSMLDASKR